MFPLLRTCALGAAILLLVGCAGVTAGKAGGGVAPTTVVLALAEGPGTPVGVAARAFADSLAAVSDEALRVDVRFRAHLGDDADDPSAQTAYRGVPYQEVTRQLRDGEVELAALPDFSWVEAGAPGIAGLKAPLVINSDALMLQVAEELGDDAIKGLREIGVEPLVLLPENIRHPVGFDLPIRTVGDFEGRSLRIVDPFVGEALRALGADPQRIEAGLAQAVADGTITGAESAFVQVASLPATGVYTSDIALGAKFNVIAAAGDWYSALSTAQREWIAEAADAAFQHALDAHKTDAAAAAAYCEAGGWVVHAVDGTAEDIAPLVAPVVARLAASPGAGAILERIRALKADLPAPTPAAECAPASVEEPPVVEPGITTAQFPEGTYRAELTVEDFLSAGVDAVTAHNHAQVWTLTFRDGEMLDIGCGGSTYTVTGDRISVVLGTEGRECGDIPGQELFNARWTAVDGGLHFSDFGPNVQGPSWQVFNETLWGAHDWVRVR
jgi:TRAP-type C4-dicarboxylate transport system substrate-binding protein